VALLQHCYNLFIEKLTNNKGFSAIIALLIALGIIVVGGGAYVLTQKDRAPTGSTTPPADIQSTGENNSAPTTEVSIDLVLSSLSVPKGKIDILWNILIPEEQKKMAEKPYLSFPYGYEGAVAQPLDLIETLTIKNGGEESAFIEAIENEQTTYIETPPRSETKATPIMLLPNSFFDESRREFKCKNRDIGKLLNYAYLAAGSVQDENKPNNICTFELPIEIKADSSITLKPDLYALSYGLTGAMVPNAFNGERKNFIKTTNSYPDGEIWLIPERYKENDDVAQRDTFNIGGFVVVNSKDNELMTKILRINNESGQRVRVKVNKTTTGIRFDDYSIPDKPFTPSQTGRDENILGMQAFWYINDFWDTQNITGKYDSNTIEMLKKFQRETNLAETGNFDKATMHVVRAFPRNVSFYENYGDEEIAVSFDSSQPYFRLFSIGSWDVNLNKDQSNSSLIKRVAKNPCGKSYCAIYAYAVDGREMFTLGGITILNNTIETKQCMLLNANNVPVQTFSIAPNEMYPQRTTLDNISSPSMHMLKCGTKSLEIEMYPQEKGRG